MHSLPILSLSGAVHHLTPSPHESFLVRTAREQIGEQLRAPPTLCRIVVDALELDDHVTLDAYIQSDGLRADRSTPTLDSVPVSNLSFLIRGPDADFAAELEEAQAESVGAHARFWADRLDSAFADFGDEYSEERAEQDWQRPALADETLYYLRTLSGIGADVEMRDALFLEIYQVWRRHAMTFDGEGPSEDFGGEYRLPQDYRLEVVDLLREHGSFGEHLLSRLFRQWVADCTAGGHYNICSLWCGAGQLFTDFTERLAEYFKAHSAPRHLGDLVRDADTNEPESPLALLLGAFEFTDHWDEWGWQWNWALREDEDPSAYGRVRVLRPACCAHEFDVFYQAQPEFLRILFRKFVTKEALERHRHSLISQIRRTILSRGFVRRDGHFNYLASVPAQAWADGMTFDGEKLPAAALVTLQNQTMEEFRQACVQRHPAILLREGLSDEEVEHFFFSAPRGGKHRISRKRKASEIDA